MTYQALLCAITANEKARFILSENEVRRLLQEQEAAQMLEDEKLLAESYARLLDSEIDRENRLKRLVAIFGAERVAGFLLKLSRAED